jgi:hypothetical protein
MTDSEESESMKLSLVFVVVTAAAVTSCSKMTIAPLSSPSPVVPKQIWSGSSGGFQVNWTTGDITASPEHASGQLALSELGRTIVDFHEITHKQTSDCDMTRQAKLQSVVGSIVSIQFSDTMKCTNGATGTGLGSVAIDLAHPKTPLLLSSLFPGHELYALQILAGRFCKTVPKNLLSRFAFSELHGNTVIVAVTLPPDCTASHLDLALNVPAALKRPLNLAAQRKKGFLWHDQPAVASGAVTTVNYHYRTSVE